MFFLIFLLAVPFTFFWFWAIIDCVRNESDPQTRHRWLLIILVFSFFGAVFYVLMRRSNRPKRLPPGGSDGESKESSSIFVPRRN
ncbi:MAG: PLD nuclease N-terminal domain-containing protein [bacterium]|nr:PLD nuclease N-terminal domain-containing protein [bacterium]